SRIIVLNQDSTGDLGDWRSGPRPQTNFYVHNAFTCQGPAADIAVSSPEGNTPDVLGYDVASLPPRAAGWSVAGVADFNGDGHPDYVLFNSSTRATEIWYLNNNVLSSGLYGPTLPPGWSVVGVADFNGDGHPDYLLFNSSTRQTAIWYLNNNVLSSGLYGPTLPVGWTLVGVADFNGDGKPDYLLYNGSTRQTAIWYLNNNVLSSGLFGPALPAG